MKQDKSASSEFILLMALLMSLTALAIDAMLPALGLIGESLNVANANNTQWIISIIFLGMSIGLILYGPISDSFGRKPVLILGLLIFLVGDLISLFATDLSTMLTGRFLQGFGGAACRVVTLAMIRDLYEGNKMARVMSLIMVFFILVPTLAPSVGQLILFVGSWHSIFVFILMVTLISLAWLSIRQPETLDRERRLPFSAAVIYSGVKETVSNKMTFTYILAAGLMFGAFIGYLSSTQQIFQVQYQKGDAFALYFGGLALVIGLSSFVNSRLVMTHKMETLCLVALLVLTINASLFAGFSQLYDGHPPMWAFLSFLVITFFCFGILFGNFNTLAVQPLGHIAGVASSIISAVQTLISVAIGGAIGQMYDGTVMPLVIGFAVCGVASVVLMLTIRQAHVEQAV